MKITISVLGRFQLFHLARELQEHGHLQRLITSYPKFETVKYGIAEKNLKSLVVHEVLNRVGVNFPQRLRAVYDPQYLVFELFDRHAAWHIPKDTEIFVGLSSGARHSMRRAQRLGAKTVLERGSTHMLHQRRVLTEEYARWGSKAVIVHPQVVAKELAEYREADFISVPSQYVKRTFLEQGVPEHKLIQNPYGVNLSNFYPVPKQDRIFRVIHCGNLSIRKGLPYLLQAFWELNLPQAELWLIGKVTEEIAPFLKKFSSPGIVLKGTFPERELNRQMSQGSVFCLASIEEGLAMVQAMAMACGLPLVITNHTGGEDIVRDGVEGFIVPVRDVEALKEKILYLYENEAARQAMGAAARARVRQGFTWQDYGERMIKHYQKILAKT
ncbi:MAG: glycosyltransferase [Deltaproteobacteria bacterium]|jgi:glycosyltransferase involved in cell wall biosynthesis